MTSETSFGNPDPRIPAGVGGTALMVAVGRATESARADRLFADPNATGFLNTAGLGDRAEEFASATGDQARAWGFFTAHTAVHTRFFDDFLRSDADASGAGRSRRAGLDTHAFRLDWPAGVTVYEADSPEVLDFKQQILDSNAARPACRRIPVAADLRQDRGRSLLAAGFAPQARSTRLPEGPLPYPTPDQKIDYSTQSPRSRPPKAGCRSSTCTLTQSPP